MFIYAESIDFLYNYTLAAWYIQEEIKTAFLWNWPREKPTAARTTQLQGEQPYALNFVLERYSRTK